MTKPNWKLLPLALALALLLSLPAGLAVAEATEKDPQPGSRRTSTRGSDFTIGSDIHIRAGEVREGPVVSIGGHVNVEGTVEEDVVVIAGSMTVSGTVRSDAVGILSNMVMEESARVEGDLVNVGGSLSGAPEVGGERVNIGLGVRLPSLGTPLGILGALIAWGKVVWLLLVFLTMLILAAIVPERVRTLSEEAPVRLGLAYLAGFGGYLALWVVDSLLAITLVGIPVLVLLTAAFFVLKVLGLAGICHYLGRRLGLLMGRDLSLLGATLLGYAPFVLVAFLPNLMGGFPGLLLHFCFRFAFWVFVELPAVGLVILTRLGSRPYGKAVPQPEAAAAPAP